MRQVFRRTAVLLALPLLWNCSERTALVAPENPSLAEVSTSRDRADETDQIHEAVYRHLMGQIGWEGAAAYCLFVGEWDTRANPSAGLMERFAGNRPLVVPGLDCSVDVTGTFYNPTGERAQTFHITSVQQKNKRATADARYHLSGRQAEGYFCQLRKRQQGWEVTSCTPVWAA